MEQVKRHSFLYEFGLLIVWLGAQVFYRKFTVVGNENMPEDDEPSILVANHQNGMMDPLMLCISNARQLHFLTRADIFKSKWNNKILRELNMLPVYRPHDRQPNMKEMNAETFKECTRRILAGDVISLFPEGNHNNRKNLRALKTGVLKVAMNALAEAKEGQKIRMIPVGLEYSNYERFREDIMIIYGEEIVVNDLVSDAPGQELQSSNLLREAINKSLNKVMINIGNQELYKAIQETRLLSESVLLEEMKLPRNQINEFRSFKEASQRIQKNAPEEVQLADDFKKEAQVYKEIKQKHGIWERELVEKEESSYSKLKNLIFLILCAPIFLPGFVTNILPMKFTDNFVKKNVKDPHFTSSIRLAIGSFSYLFYYLIIFITVWIVWGFVKSLVVTSILAITGVVALRYFESFIKRKNHKKIESMDNKDRADLFAQRDKLISLIRQLTIKN